MPIYTAARLGKQTFPWRYFLDHNAANKFPFIHIKTAFIDTMQTNSTVKDWDHALECSSPLWGGRCSRQISSDVSRKIVEEFLSRLRDSPTVKYSQKDIENLGFEVSKERHEHKERKGVWEGCRSVVFIDVITAKLLEMDGQSIFRINVVLDRRVQNARASIDWDEIRTRRRVSDYAWSFWLSANLRPASKPSLRMKCVMEMSRPEWPIGNEASLKELLEILDDKVSDLTMENQSKEDTMSRLQKTLSDIGNMLPSTVTGRSNLPAYDNSTYTLSDVQPTQVGRSMQGSSHPKRRCI